VLERQTGYLVVGDLQVMTTCERCAVLAL
jgi:hypothetical protein